MTQRPADDSGLEQARQAKRTLLGELADDERIVGIGIARAGDGYLVKVNLAVAAAYVVPSTVDGVPVVTEVVGTIRPLRP